MTNAGLLPTVCSVYDPEAFTPRIQNFKTSNFVIIALFNNTTFNKIRVSLAMHHTSLWYMLAQCPWPMPMANAIVSNWVFPVNEFATSYGEIETGKSSPESGVSNYLHTWQVDQSFGGYCTTGFACIKQYPISRISHWGSKVCIGRLTSDAQHLSSKADMSCSWLLDPINDHSFCGCPINSWIADGSLDRAGAVGTKLETKRKCGYFGTFFLWSMLCKLIDNAKNPQLVVKNVIQLRWSLSVAE